MRRKRWYYSYINDKLKLIIYKVLTISKCLLTLHLYTLIVAIKRIPNIFHEENFPHNYHSYYH